MTTRRYPPQPALLPVGEKFTVWAIYQGAWWSVRSFLSIDEAREFARATIRSGILITTDTITHNRTASETL